MIVKCNIKKPYHEGDKQGWGDGNATGYGKDAFECTDDEYTGGEDGVGEGMGNGGYTDGYGNSGGEDREECVIT